MLLIISGVHPPSIDGKGRKVDALLSEHMTSQENVVMADGIGILSVLNEGSNEEYPVLHQGDLNGGGSCQR